MQHMMISEWGQMSFEHSYKIFDRNTEKQIFVCCAYEMAPYTFILLDAKFVSTFISKKKLLGIPGQLSFYY